MRLRPASLPHAGSSVSPSWKCTVRGSSAGSVPSRRCAEAVAQSYPDSAGRAGRAKLLGDRVDAMRRPEAAARAGKDVRAEKRDALVATVEEIGDLHEELQIGGRLISCIEMNDRMRRQAAVDILIVLVAERVLRRCVHDIDADGKLLARCIFRAQLHRIARYGGEAIAPGGARR